MKHEKDYNIHRPEANGLFYQCDNHMGYDEISSRANAMMQERVSQDINQRFKLAEEMYRENQNDAKALWTLYHHYDKGYGGVAVDEQKALQYLRAAANEGHAGACYELSRKLLFNEDHESIEEAKFYTDEESVQKCISKAGIFNEPYYRQQDYIDELIALRKVAEFKKPKVVQRYVPY